VAETFSGREKAARLTLVDGAPGALWRARRKPQVVFDFIIGDGRIVGRTGNPCWPRCFCSCCDDGLLAVSPTRRWP
jgi:hypothetical protein